MSGIRTVVAVLLFIAPALVRADSFSVTFRQALQTDDKNLKLELLTKALDSWTTNDPQSDKAIVYGSRANVYADLKRHDLALADFNAALGIEPNDVTRLYNRGNSLYHLGMFDAALSDFNRALELDPDYWQAYHNRGMILGDVRGDLEGALNDFNKALSQTPGDAMTLNMRARIYEKLHQPEKALADFAKALESDPGGVSIWVNRGALFSREKKLALAIADFDQALRLDPANQTALQNRGSALMGLRRYEAVIADLSRLSAPVPEASVILGLACLRLNRLDDALRYLDRGLSQKPAYALGLMNRAEVYRRMNKPEMEMKDLDRAVAVSSTTARPHAFRGSMLLLRGRVKEAEAEGITAVRLNPKYAGGEVLLGRVSFEKDDLEAASRHFESALAVREAEEAALLGLALVDFKTGRTEPARARWEKTAEAAHWLAKGIETAGREGYFFTEKEAAVYKTASAAFAKPRKD